MNQYRLLKAVLLRVLVAAIAVLTDTYANTLFLSSYDKNKIPYLYFALAIVGFVAMQSSQRYLKQNFVKFLQATNFIFIGFLILCVILSGHALIWFPFCAAVFIMTMSVIFATTSNISVVNLFGLREFKAINAWLNFSATMGFIVTGFVIFLLLKLFSLSALLYSSIFLLIIVTVLNGFIRFHQEPVDQSRHAPPPMPLNQNPLFLYALLSSLLVLLLMTFSDYSLKSLLSQQFTKEEIGRFLGPLTAVINVTMIFTQILLLPILLRRLSMSSLLLITPIGFAIFAVLMLIYPNLWTVAMVFGFGTVLRVAFFSNSFQMVVNAYAPALRSVVQYQVQSLGRLGTGFAAFVLIIFTWMGGLRLLASSIIFISVVMIYICLNIGKYYFDMLKTAINLHRFNTDYLGTQKLDEALTLRTAEEAIESAKPDVILFGLSLLNRLRLKKIPVAVFNALHSPLDEIKKMAIRVIKHSKDTSVVEPLLKQLSDEKNPEMIWALVKAILPFSQDALSPYAISMISNEEPAIKASAIRIFLTSKEGSQLKFGREEFVKMLNDTDRILRYWAVNILKTGLFKDFKEYILKLMNDSDHEVVQNTIFAARLYPDPEIIDHLINKTQEKTLAHTVGDSLVAMGPSVIPKLLAHIHSLKSSRQINVAILLLAKFSNMDAEEALLDILQSGNLALLETCVITLAYRTKKYWISEDGRQIVLHYALSEVIKIKKLRAYISFYKDADILGEISSRIYYAEKRFLYLLASFGEPTTILQIIPTLLMSDKTSRAYDSALELLEICIPEKKLKYSISSVFETKTNVKALRGKVFDGVDPWLALVIDYKSDNSRDKTKDPLIEKILLLRKISLFSHLSAELLQDIAEIIQTKNVKATEMLFKEEDNSDGLYIVVKGEIDIIKNGEPIGFCSEGKFFGELALLDESPRYAAAVAKTDTFVFFIEKHDFNRLADDIPEILKTMIKTVISYLRANST